MNGASATGSGPSADLLVDIIETLEACGLEQEEFQLYDSIDVEVLEQILHSPADDIEVRFTVAGIRLAVTQERVDVLIDDGSIAPS